MIEVIVASGIMVTAVAAALTLVQSSVNAEKESESLIIAGNLAREGLEVVRSIRDSNWLAGSAFDAGLDDVGGDHLAIPVFSAATGSWALNFTPTDVNNPTARIYSYTTSSGIFADGLMVQSLSQPADTSPSRWWRAVILDPICDTGSGPTVLPAGSFCGVGTKVGIRVTSRVRWAKKGGQATVDMEERLMDWR